MNQPHNRWHPDVTVAAVCREGDRFLLVKERSKTTGEMVYNQPAGHLDEHESLVEAVIREVREETCRHFTPISLVGLYRHLAINGRTYIRYTFYGTVSEVDPNLQLDPDITSTHWFSLKEIAQLSGLRSPLVLDCINDYLAGDLYPLNVLKDG